MVHDERRRPTLIQKIHNWVMVIIIPLIVVPMTAWILLSVIEAQREIVGIKLQVVQVQREIQKHDEEAREDAKGMGSIHHTKNIIPCTGCHHK